MPLYTRRHLLKPDFSQIPHDTSVIIGRLKELPTPFELFGVLFGLSLVGIFLWLYQQGFNVFYDFNIYLNATSGFPKGYFYPSWITPIFIIFSEIPFSVAIFLWAAINILGVAFASRVFGGNTQLILITYQMFYAIFYGQIVGLMAAGLGLIWLGLLSRKWWLVGAGILLAFVKPQSGMMFAIILILYVWPGWKNVGKILIIPLFALIVSLILYPGWPILFIKNLLSHSVDTGGSITLWPALGAFCLLLLIPPLVLPISKSNRLLMALALIPLVMPYYQQTDLLILMVFPIGSIATFLGNIGFLFPIYRLTALKLAIIVPLFLYLYILITAVAGLINRRLLPTFAKSDQSKHK